MKRRNLRTIPVIVVILLGIPFVIYSFLGDLSYMQNRLLNVVYIIITYLIAFLLLFLINKTGDNNTDKWLK